MNRKILYFMLLPVILAACNKSDSLDIAPPENLGGETIKPTAIDQWILDSLTNPYNIAVKYRWEPWELNLNATLTPPQEDKIIPAMSAIRRIWIEPYNAETGSEMFMKKYAPKQFKLVGSVEYQVNGTVLLGQAEGGNNIAFFDINQNFDRDPIVATRRMIHTAHHEFAHVLHQNIMYPQEFKGISARLGLAGYTGTWFNVDDSTAYENGYITPYAMSGYDDDFADMVSVMLAEGKSWFDNLVAIQEPTAQEAFRTKEQLIVSYFRETWNIDFYSLQARVQSALSNAVEVSELFDYDRQFTTASVSLADQNFLPQPASFVTMYENASAELAALPAAYGLDSFQLVSIDDTTAILAFYLKKGSDQVLGLFGYDDRGSGNSHTYAFFGADSIGAEIQNAVLDILIYFDQRQFNLSWYQSPADSPFPRVRFSPVDATDDYFTARLLP